MSDGTCFLCRKDISSSKMTTHLKSCRVKNSSLLLNEKRKGATSNQHSYFLLKIQGKYEKEYWMYIEIDSTSEITLLDMFLREIWVECCGHLSCFEVAKKIISSSDEEEFYGAKVSGWVKRKKNPYEQPVSNLFRTRKKVSYQYDFGTTTDLDILKMDERVAKDKNKQPILLLARNKPQERSCTLCNKNAALFHCCECNEEMTDQSIYCDKCLMEHEHADDYAFTISNSPRSGMCGYDGENMQFTKRYYVS